MSFVYKDKYERRARGFEDAIGHEVNIIWGDYHPKTDGINIWLPDRKRENYQTEDDFRCAFGHEISHILFNSDTKNMGQWVDAYDNGPKLPFHDPFGLMGNIAESLIQCLEDHRVDSLYSELLNGAGERLAKVKYRKSPENDDITKDPLVAVYYIRSAHWNIGQSDWDCDPYKEAKEEWGDEIDVDLLWEVMDELECSDPQALFHASERIMQEILPWYEERVKFAIDDDDVEGIQQDLSDERDELDNLKEEFEELQREKKSKDQERLEAEADGEFDEAEKIKKEIEEIEKGESKKEREIDSKKNKIDLLEDQLEKKSEQSQEETEQLKELREKTDDIEDTLETREVEDPDLDNLVVDGNIPGSGGEDMEDEIESIKSKLHSEEASNFSPEETVPSEIVKQRPTASKKGQVFYGVTKEIVQELRRIYGRKRNRRNEVGSEVDIDAFIDAEAQNTCETDIMREEILELGFNCTIVLDLSMSMMGKKLAVCRNVGCTMWKVFEEMEETGIDFNFEIIGYGGGTTKDQTLIRECKTMGDVKRLAHHPEYATTPTWHAINYTRNHMRGYEGDKMMIVVTDGTPTGIKDSGSEVESGKALRYTRREIKEAREQGIETFTLGIDVNLSPEEMSRVYGNYENVHSESEAGQILLEFIQTEIRKHMTML